MSGTNAVCTFSSQLGSYLKCLSFETDSASLPEGWTDTDVIGPLVECAGTRQLPRQHQSIINTNTLVLYQLNWLTGNEND